MSSDACSFGTAHTSAVGKRIWRGEMTGGKVGGSLPIMAEAAGGGGAGWAVFLAVLVHVE